MQSLNSHKSYFSFMQSLGIFFFYFNKVINVNKPRFDRKRRSTTNFKLELSKIKYNIDWSEICNFCKTIKHSRVCSSLDSRTIFSVQHCWSLLKAFSDILRIMTRLYIVDSDLYVLYVLKRKAISSNLTCVFFTFPL